MFITKNLQKNITFLVFTLLVAVMLSGAVSAALEAPADYSSAYVVENNYSFTGPASIQDAADNYETLEGYHIDVETGAHEEQVTFTKNLHIKGMGTNPEDTIIWTYSDEGATVTIEPGVAVLLENLHIWNSGNGQPIINNGQLTLINCFVNGDYFENEIMGLAAGGEEIPEETNTETMTMGSEEELLGSPTYSDTAEGTDGTSTESTEPVTTEPVGEEPANDDPGMPLASLASGMLMVMGGAVVNGKKHQ